MSTVTTSTNKQSDHRVTSAREVYIVRGSHNERSHVYGNFRTPSEDISDTIHELWEMLDWPEDWNGCGAAKPRLSSIMEAKRWIVQMRADAITTGKTWRRPHVVPDQDGDIVFEWSNGARTLSAYVSVDAVEYLKVWGADMDSQMIEGEVTSREDNSSLWNWLMEKV